MADRFDLVNFAKSVATTLGGTTANVNFDANTLFVDGVNNRVGIGTASPTAACHVAGTLQSQSGSSFAQMYSDGGAAFFTSIGAFPSIFLTNGTERMRIDASGRVTMPGQPMFMGSPTNDYSSGSMPTGVIPFTALYNNGSHYNAGTSRFTAPVTGWYRITWGGLQLSGAVTSLQINGTRTYNGVHYVTTPANAPPYVTMTQTVLRTLNANDYLTIEGWNGGGYYNAWYLWSVELVA